MNGKATGRLSALRQELISNPLQLLPGDNTRHPNPMENWPFYMAPMVVIRRWWL